MISDFINSITNIQLVTILFLAFYLLVYGIKYHLLAIYAYLSGRGVSNNWAGVALNWCGYVATGCCLYWWV